MTPPPDGLIAAAGERDDALVRTASVPRSATLRLNCALLVGALGTSLVLLWGVSFTLPLIFQAAGGFNWDAYRLLDVRHEGNLPTLFATVQLIVAAALSLLIARLEPIRRGHWMGLAGLFAFLAVDEAAQLHELLSYVKLTMPRAFLQEWTWALFYAPVVVVIGCLYVPFLRRLPIGIAVTFLAAGILFVSGSLGLEVLGTLQAKVLGLPRNHAHFNVQLHAEELCELLGIFLFICGTCGYLRKRWPHIRILTQ